MVISESFSSNATIASTAEGLSCFAKAFAKLNAGAALCSTNGCRSAAWSAQFDFASAGHSYSGWNYSHFVVLNTEFDLAISTSHASLWLVAERRCPTF